ncbi:MULTISPECIES: class I SAM-dependent methyltransferase [unclassified Cupriavidus]|uniref:methyltransferase n=1 Tax=unclassified Cupriavidus TaxID=2640874 RepID=UPI001C008624|nr:MULTISPECIES: class I SAM-dependent methyltransferase [unclassified Cupriavidus]MCA3185898.1 class I SAM-dependent methyltransferase [Cupriavidus sp.]MCA3192925.1 class I SAM-dependent methyltransferase [Cupriavidus sp.]MCA3195126.1 class I SAM-dependent methyltransferase [Cupriavidus sp.]MCA3204096.1 class I SAM-dependent methyltransferase [Cupriavidus sp.]MCA3209313.1 class I SAM-dependent methyltransferase [Cupriavidus sp.]
MSVNESLPTIHWTEDGAERSALWRSEAGLPPPRRVVIADDQTQADTAYRLASEGTALLWRGDFQNARQLLQAMARRVDRKPQRKARGADKAPASLTESFHKHRLAQSQRARTLGMLLLPFDAGHVVPLRRAPDVHEACEQVYGPADAPYVASMRELLGLIGAYEWRRKGVEIPVLGERIHPWYGVFSPVRGEYIELVAKEPLPSTALAFDIGAGTGVLAAVLAQRGVKRVVGTDQDPRALGCARENIDRLGLANQVEIVEADLFPAGRAPLVVCNPPWVPARPSSPIEHAVFDPDSRMLRGFLSGLAAHLEPGGQGWLILSDFAEHLGLRSRDELLGWIDAAGLKVLGRSDIRPRHPKSTDADDPLFAARKAEVTSLWRLAAK